MKWSPTKINKLKKFEKKLTTKEWMYSDKFMRFVKIKIRFYK